MINHVRFIQTIINKSMLGRVTPLSRPRSVYKSDVERRFLGSWDQMAKWPWRTRSMAPVGITNQGNMSSCVFGANLEIQAQTHYKLLCGISKNSKSKWPKMTLNIGLNMLPSDSFMSWLDYLLGYSTVDCQACGVWCRGLTTCLLYVGPIFGNLVWNDSGFEIMENKVFIVFEYVLHIP